MSATAEAATAAVMTSELDGLRTRRGELDKQLQEAATAHESARAGLVAGTADLDAVQSAQGRHSALREAVATLDGRINDLAARHAARADAERREQIAASLVQIAREADAAIRRYGAANREAQAALEPHLAEMADALQELVRLRNAFIKTAHPIVSLQTHDPATKRQAERFLAGLAGRGGLESVLTPWRGTPQTAHDKDGSLPTPGDFGLAFALQAAVAQRVFK